MRSATTGAGYGVAGLLGHLVRAGQCLDPLPYSLGACRVHDRPPDRTQRPLLLLSGRRVLAVQFDGVCGEVPYDDGEEFVEHVFVEAGEVGLFQDELCVHDEGEELADGEEEVEVAALLGVGGRGGDELAESVGLFAQAGDVGQVRVRLEGGPPVVEAHRAEAAGRPCWNRKVSSAASRRVGTSG